MKMVVPMPSRSNDRETRSRPDRVVVGTVRRAHGLRGEVSVEVDSDVDDRFAVGAELWLVPTGAGSPRRVRVVSNRPVKSGCLIRFSGIEDRNAAEAVRGARLEIDRADVPPAEEGSWYFFELVGCECIEAEQGSLGQVTDVIEDGGGLLLEVAGSDDAKLLIPFVNDFLDEVDVPAGRIELRLPPGLIETCTSPH